MGRAQFKMMYALTPSSEGDGLKRVRVNNTHEDGMELPKKEESQ